MPCIAERRRLRGDPPARLIAGIERGWRQLRHHLEVPGKARADRLGVAAQDIALTLAALLLQPSVECLPGGEARHRHHEVAPGIADQPLDAAFVIALAGAAIAVTEQVM
jgi:hypothetical protein